MINSIYKISFSKSAQELNDDYERLSDHEKEKIASLDAESFFDYEDESGYICFLITNAIEIKKYLGILKSNFIFHVCEDLSRDILKFNVKIDDEIKIDNVNHLKYNFFIDDVEQWILKNLDIDTVLDRISEVGIDNLTVIEKNFLKSYH